MSKIKLLFASLFISTIFFMIALFFFLGKRYYFGVEENLISQSIDTILSNYEYQVINKNINDKSLDVSVELHVNLRNIKNFKQILETHYSTAYHDEEMYFKDYIREKLDIKKSLHPYKLYVADPILGKGSICELHPCKVSILYTEIDQNMYIYFHE